MHFARIFLRRLKLRAGRCVFPARCPSFPTCLEARLIRIPPCLFVLSLAIGIAAAPAAAQQYPAEPGNGVADMAGVLDAADADSIRAILSSLRSDPGVEARVLTVQNIARYRTNDASPEAFATAVYNDWKLGYDQAHDGVLVMVSVDDRFARIELGDNAPAHMDARAQAIMDGTMVPRFREGDYSGGVLRGVLAVAEALRGTPTSAAAPQPAGGFGDPPPPFSSHPTFSTGEGDPGGAGGAGVIVLILTGLGAAGISAAAYRRNRKRNCAKCGRQMQRLDEKGDDVYLDSGRQLEEVLGSVDYDVWHCAGCGNHQVLAYGSILSSKQKCPGCGYKTVDVNKTVLERPTYTSQGRERIEKACRHCSWRDDDIVTLPRLQRSSSSSRSFGSFGGGSSGGGWSGGGGGGSSGGSSSGRGASGSW
jgi:uncharacterized protein